MKYPLTSTAQQILEKRYIHKELGESSWEDVTNRVLSFVLPDKKDDFLLKQMLLERYFLPNSPTLVNAGTKIGGLSACFVVPFEDSIEGIAETKYWFMKIAQKGGGCGTSLSNIRPRGLPVAGSTHANAGGPVSFYNTICEDMKAMTQAGFREMAMMGTMSVTHPDIKHFIMAKSEEGVMHTTNLSVVVTSDFMASVVMNSEFRQFFVKDDEIIVDQMVPAKEIFDLVVHQAWLNGEPGLLFDTTINRDTPYRYSDQTIYASNPCGEQPLPEFGACNLGSIDVSKFFDSEIGIDYIGLGTNVDRAITFLDAAIDKAEWPIPEIGEWVQNNRPVGLGIMGFADLLLEMGIEYGSQESLEIAEDLISFIYREAIKTSEWLGEQYGTPRSCTYLSTPRRNITVLSIAPTGSLALIAGCSHGIEPIFAPTTVRNDKTGVYVDTNPHAEAEYFRSAINDDETKIVTWKQHIDIQAKFQEYVDSGVSKTINLPNSATKEDVREAFMYAWEKGCKGITVYRDGSRDEQVLSTDFKETPVTLEERPRVLDSKTVKLSNGGEGNVYVTVGYTNETPTEVFVNGPSVRLYDVQMRDGFSRLSSLALRYGVPVIRLVKELRQVRAQSLKDVPAQIASVLEELEIKDHECPDCGSELVPDSGCYSCTVCGFSRCS